MLKMTAREFLLIYREWRNVIMRMWESKCAFPGCINKPGVYRITNKYNKIKAAYSPLNCFASCKYHAYLLRPQIKTFMQNNKHYQKIDIASYKNCKNMREWFKSVRIGYFGVNNEKRENTNI